MNTTGNSEPEGRKPHQIRNDMSGAAEKVLQVGAVYNNYGVPFETFMTKVNETFQAQLRDKDKQIDLYRHKLEQVAQRERELYPKLSHSITSLSLLLPELERRHSQLIAEVRIATGKLREFAEDNVKLKDELNQTRQQLRDVDRQFSTAKRQLDDVQEKQRLLTCLVGVARTACGSAVREMRTFQGFLSAATQSSLNADTSVLAALLEKDGAEFVSRVQTFLSDTEKSLDDIQKHLLIATQEFFGDESSSSTFVELVTWKDPAPLSDNADTGREPGQAQGQNRAKKVSANVTDSAEVQRLRSENNRLKEHQRREAAKSSKQPPDLPSPPNKQPTSPYIAVALIIAPGAVAFFSGTLIRALFEATTVPTGKMLLLLTVAMVLLIGLLIGAMATARRFTWRVESADEVMISLLLIAGAVFGYFHLLVPSLVISLLASGIVRKGHGLLIITIGCTGSTIVALSFPAFFWWQWVALGKLADIL